MSVLAQLAHGLVSIQCDLCVPPVLTINTPDELRRTGWALRSAGEQLDVCPNCSVQVAPRHRRARADAQPAQPDPARLPNVVIVGATKAGTTSMHNYLAVHPDVAVSTEKELRFFQDPDCLGWLGAYQSFFATGTRYRVESTPFYSKAPCFPGVVDRMADLVPDARVIYLVRDPVDRIIAEYVEQMQWQAASRSLDVELADADDPRNWLVASSRYATQLRDYLRRFDRDRVLVLDLADLAADTAGVMGQVFGFLGLDQPALTSEEYGRFNTREDKSAFPAWMLAMRRGPLVRASRLLPERPRKVVSELAWSRLRTPVGRPEVEERTLDALRDVLRPEVDELRELTGLAFATWSL